MSEPLRTAREQAALLGISTGALLRWAKAGKVPNKKYPSGAVRFVPEDVDAWLEACERGTTGDATREVSPTPDATRRPEVSSLASLTPLRDDVARPKEERHAS